MKKHTEIDVRSFWNMLADFWNHFEDRETISQVWRGMLQAMSNVYYQLYQVSLSKGIETVPYRWISDWEPVVLDKTTYIDTSDVEILVSNPDYDEKVEGSEPYIHIKLSEFDWTNPDYRFTKRNPKGVIYHDSEKDCDYVYDSENNVHYRGFPYEYRLNAGIKDITYLVETPRNGVKFSPNVKKVHIDEQNVKKVHINYDNGHERPFDYEELSDQHGFATEFVANGVLASGEPGTQDFLVLPAENSLFGRLLLKIKPNTRMWTHVNLRQSYNIYETFGYLLRYFKPDDLKYLREVQGLWLSYLSSPTIAALQRGLTVIRALPFALQSGVITNIVQEPAKLIINHVEPVYLLGPNENNIEDEPRNTRYNPYDVAITVPELVYEKDGTQKEPIYDVELEARPFTSQSLTTGDYIYSMNEEILTATFSFKSIEETVGVPDVLTRQATDLTVLSCFRLDNRYCIRLEDRILMTPFAFDDVEEGTVLEITEDGRIRNTSFSSEVLSPIKPGDMITGIDVNGHESYIEINSSIRFLITEEEAKTLKEKDITSYRVLYTDGQDITIGSLVNVRLSREMFYQLHEGDYINYISPSKLTVDIDNSSYTYYTDSEVKVVTGQYVEKYDPLVNAIRVKDYITNPSWIFDEVGNTSTDKQRNFQVLADMWHSFLVEADEESAPQTFEESRMMNAFIKEAKPTYVDYRMIVHIDMEDTLVMNDEFDRDPKYEFETEYPWAGRGLLVFDGCQFHDEPYAPDDEEHYNHSRHYKFDDGQHFDDSGLADPFFAIAFPDHYIFEDSLRSPTCFNEGMLFDGKCHFNDYEKSDSLTVDSYPIPGSNEDSYFDEVCFDSGMKFDSGSHFDKSIDSFEVSVVF